MMTKSYQPFIAALMAILLVVGSVGSAVAGLQDCLPKTCCCMKVDHKAAPHISQTDTAGGCTGNSPCCQVEPVHQAQDIAALAATPELPEAKALFLPLNLGQQITAQITPSLARKFQHNGKPRALLVPLYLETQMLLC